MNGARATARPTEDFISQTHAGSLFDGGGVMGELMRSIDWADTPVGPVERWPQSLKTALSILLKQRTAVFIFWGPQHVQFYNDAYRPILGTKKHPAAMGQRGADCWPEIWDIILPMLESVHRGESTAVEDGLLVIDRTGYLEEGYYTYTYSPIAIESGAVGGVFCLVYDTTARVIGERRLRTLRDLASREIARDADDACRLAAATLSGNPHDVPFIALYLYDSDRKHARLVGAAGIEAGSPASPVSISFDENELSVIARAAGTSRVEYLPDLAQHLGPLPGGPWPVGAESGLVLPLTLPGQALPAGFMLAGVSPRKRLDTSYRTFFELAAGQIATAIAEARAYEEERKRAESLAELDRVKTAFFSNVSHEFRTPLTLMLGPIADILAHPPSSIEECREDLALAHRNGLRLLRLVNTLLDFSRIEAGRIQARYEPTDLATFTSDLASVFRSAIEKAGLRLTVNCAPLLEPVLVDREMWEKMVLNLLSNAFKFTLDGEIAVSLAASGKNVELSIADTGIGIEESEIPHVFDRFHQIKAARGRSREGSGIGLALVQELARLHGGGVRVASVHGKGSVFTVWVPLGSGHLPLERVGGERTPEPFALESHAFVDEAMRWLPDGAQSTAWLDGRATARETAPAADGPVANPRARVLVVDDNADMRDYLLRLLGREYQVEAVPDGETALAMVRSRPPDLLLADVMMPGLDGFGLLQAIRGDPAAGALPVILLSARAGEESRVEGLRTGADDYLVKPFSARELLARVSSRLEIARLRSDAAAAEHRLRAEAEAERRRLRELIQQAPTMIAVLHGPDHVFRLVNREYMKSVGRSEGSLIDKPIREALPEIVSQGFPDLLDQVYRTGQPLIATEALARLDRRGAGLPEDCYFTFVYQPWKMASGETEGIIVHAVDVTESVCARHRIEESERRLSTLVKEEREARATAELLNRLGHSLLSQLDASALVQSMTDLATELAGAEFGAFFHHAVGEKGEPYTLHKVSGTAPAAFGDFSIPRIIAAFPAAFQGGGVVRSGDLMQGRGNGKNAPDLPASYLAVPVVSRSGEILGGLFFGHSAAGRFTERHGRLVAGVAAQAAVALDNARLFEQAQWVQNELKRSNEDLRRANRDLETFAYSASHDLQEPLRNVAINAQLLQRNNDRLDSDQMQLLDGILQGARWMETLIQDLLAYTRAIRLGDGPAQTIATDQVFNQVLEVLKNRIEQCGAAITASALPVVSVHEVHLSQLLQNLIGNALKYRGQEEPRVHVSAAQQDGFWVFSVADNGIGIEPRYAEKIFELFKRLHTRDQYPGSGVGLAICQRIVEQYGGRVWLERSIPGAGSTFCFSLPDRPLR
jgi:signal transduction histidine kinase/CheY-like chemotaxis protein